MAAKKTTQTTKKAEDVKINAPVKTVETVKTETVAPAVKAEVKETVKEAPKAEVKAEAVKAEKKAEVKAAPKKRGPKPKTEKTEKKEAVQNGICAVCRQGDPDCRSGSTGNREVGSTGTSRILHQGAEPVCKAGRQRSILCHQRQRERKDRTVIYAG